MDALKDIPSNIERIETEIGVAYLQKIDIFKKTMWFSYPRAESWIPLSAEKVKEFAAMNADGKKPAELGVVQDDEDDKVIAPDYENVVGQDSLTRLDDRNRKKRKKKKKSPNNTNDKPQDNAARPKQEANPQAKPANRRERQKPNPNNNTEGQQPKAQSAEGKEGNQNPRPKRRPNNNRNKNNSRPQDGGSKPEN